MSTQWADPTRESFGGSTPPPPAVSVDPADPNRTARRLALLDRFAPSLAADAGAAFRLATAPVVDDDEWFRAIDKAGAAADLKDYAEWYKRLPKDHQERRWESLSDGERQALRAGGYSAGFLDAERAGGIWNAVTSVARLPTRAITGAVGGVLEGFNKMERAVSHTFRTADAFAEGQGLPGAAAFLPGVGPLIGLHDQIDDIRQGGLANARPGAAQPWEEQFDPAIQNVRPSSPTWNLIELWRDTNDGGRYFTARGTRKALEALGTDDAETWGMFTRLVRGDDPAEIAMEYAEPGTPEYEAALSQVMAFANDPKVTAAVETLGPSRGGFAEQQSFGREAARAYGINGGPAFHLLSGVYDAVFQLVADPTNLIGVGVARSAAQRSLRGIGHLSDEARYIDFERFIAPDAEARSAARAVTRPDEAGYFAELARAPLSPTERWAALVSDTARHGTWGTLVEARPEMARFASTVMDLSDEYGGLKTLDDVRAMMANSRTLASIAARDAVRGSADKALVFPAISRAGSLAAGGKLKLSEAIDWSRHGDIDGALPSIARAPLGALGSFTHSITNLMPKKGWISYDGKESMEPVWQLFGFATGGKQRRKLYDEFFNAGDVSAKRAVVESYYRTMLDRFGILDSPAPAAAELRDRLLRSVHQVYAPAGLDMLPGADGIRHVGLYPKAHKAEGFAVPDFDELMRASRRNAVATVAYKGMNNVVAASYMKAWKPLAIIRAGFIFRAVGDEILAAILRFGTGEFLKASTANFALGPVREGKVLDALRPGLQIDDAPATFAQRFERFTRGRSVVDFNQAKPIPGFSWGAYLTERLTAPLPDALRAKLAGGVDLTPNEMREAIAANLSRSVRRFAANRVDRAYLDSNLARAARDLALNPLVAREVMEDLHGSRAWADPGLFATVPERSWRTRELGNTRMRPDYGRFLLAGEDSVNEWLWGIDGTYAMASHDPVWRLHASLHSSYVTPAQAERFGGYERLETLQQRFALAPAPVRKGLLAYEANEMIPMGVDPATGEIIEVDGLTFARRKLGERAMTKADRAMWTELVDEMERLPLRDRQLLLHDPNAIFRDLDEAWAPVFRDVLSAEDLTVHERTMLYAGLQHTFLSRLRQQYGPQMLLDEAGNPTEFLAENYDDILAIARQTEADIVADLTERGSEIQRAGEDLDLDRYFIESVSHMNRADWDATARRLHGREGDDWDEFVMSGSELHVGVVAEALGRMTWQRQFEGLSSRRRELLAKVRRGDDAALDTLITELSVARLMAPDVIDDTMKMDFSRVTVGPNGEALPVATRPAKGERVVYTVVDPEGRNVEEFATTDYGVAFQRARRAGLEVGYATLNRKEWDIASRRAASALSELDRSPRAVAIPPEMGGKVERLGSQTTTLDDGTVLPGVPLHEALGQWAKERYVPFSKMTFRGRTSGETITQASVPVAFRRYREDHAHGLDAADLPEQVAMPSYVVDEGRKLTERIAEGGYELIGRPITAMVRKPMTMLAYSEGLDDFAAIEQTFRDDKLGGAARSVLDGLRKRGGLVGDNDWLEAAGLAAAGADDRQLADHVRTAWRELGDEDRSVLVRYARQEAEIERLRVQTALQSAVNKTVPFIDDHRLRSQMDGWVRNVMPFLFAEVQFLKRWGKTFKHSPAALRRAQLTYHGIRHMGWVESNEYGEDSFVYPWSGPANSAVSALVDKLLPGAWSVPINVGFSGQVKYAAPGIDEPGAPGFAPWVALPLNAITSLFPELAPGTRNLLGERGAGRSVADTLVPTTLMRFWRAATSDAESDAQFSSAMLQSIQTLAAHDEEHVQAQLDRGVAPEDVEHLHPGLRPDANTAEQQALVDTVRNHTRVITLMRAIMGFSGPASPSNNLPDSLAPEFKAHLSDAMAAGQTFEEATQEFLARNPSATAFTVFASDIPSKAPLPSTARSLEFMRDHGGFLSAYPAAGPWFMPQVSDDEAYDRAARAEQFRLGLRDTEAPDEYLRSLAFAQAADVYFAAKEAHDAYLAQPLSAEAKRAEAANWKQWKGAYLAQHPIFAEELESTDNRARRRQILTEMAEALARPEARAAEHYPQMSTFVEAFFAHQAWMDAWGDDRRSQVSRLKRDERQRFANWAASYASVHPEVRAFYQRVIRPEIGADPTIEE